MTKIPIFDEPRWWGGPTQAAASAFAAWRKGFRRLLRRPSQLPASDGATQGAEKHDGKHLFYLLSRMYDSTAPYGLCFPLESGILARKTDIFCKKS